MNRSEMYAVLADIYDKENEVITVYRSWDDDGFIGQRFENGKKWLFVANKHIETLKKEQLYGLLKGMKGNVKIDFQGAKEAIGGALAAL
jgi:hypothetical protein